MVSARLLNSSFVFIDGFCSAMYRASNVNKNSSPLVDVFSTCKFWIVMFVLHSLKWLYTVCMFLESGQYMPACLANIARIASWTIYLVNCPASKLRLNLWF